MVLILFMQPILLELLLVSLHYTSPLLTGTMLSISLQQTLSIQCVCSRFIPVAYSIYTRGYFNGPIITEHTIILHFDRYIYSRNYFGTSWQYWIQGCIHAVFTIIDSYTINFQVLYILLSKLYSCNCKTYTRYSDSVFFIDSYTRGLFLFLLPSNISSPVTHNLTGEVSAFISYRFIPCFPCSSFSFSNFLSFLYWFLVFNRKLPYHSFSNSLN